MIDNEDNKPVRGCPVDAHVHFHRAELVPLTLDAAAENFGRVTPPKKGLLGALLLTQASGERVFEQIKVNGSIGDWRTEPVPQEPESLVARREDVKIAIVCGRQVRAKGGLEVLGLGTCQYFPDGASVAETVAAVHGSGALTILPWGFGKWLGSRGRVVRDTLQSVGPRIVSLGDNGSRLAVLRAPALIRQSELDGFRVLPGTDPFPFAKDYRRVGGFGFLAGVTIDESAPWAALRSWLEGLRQSPPGFGEASGPIRFVINQVGIQFYNRFFRDTGR